ncbi:hypothetical protein [Geminicoccus roseus]|uniref:hypothetical protein n=1 Tax=Geminicoccus roseus TaxID=404900 RepID=UPI0004006525|nr:hypothetical protein [Geminicoccus roseus]
MTTTATPASGKRPGVLIRDEQDVTYFIPLDDLRNFRLPDDQQRGSPMGDRAIDALNAAAPIHRLKNAILSEDGMEFEADPNSPRGGKDKFKIDSIVPDPTSDRGGKDKFAPGRFGDD